MNASFLMCALFSFITALEQDGPADRQGDGGGPLLGAVRLPLRRPPLPRAQTLRRQLWGLLQRRRLGAHGVSLGRDENLSVRFGRQALTLSFVL